MFCAVLVLNARRVGRPNQLVPRSLAWVAKSFTHHMFAVSWWLVVVLAVVGLAVVRFRRSI